MAVNGDCCVATQSWVVEFSSGKDLCVIIAGGGPFLSWPPRPFLLFDAGTLRGFGVDATGVRSLRDVKVFGRGTAGKGFWLLDGAALLVE